MDEVITKLLQTTGLSCDDLLSKLQEYKSVQDNTPKNETNTNKENETTSENVEIEKTDCNLEKSVILETKSSETSSNLINVDDKATETKLAENGVDNNSIEKSPEENKETQSIKIDTSNNKNLDKLVEKPLLEMPTKPPEEKTDITEDITNKKSSEDKKEASDEETTSFSDTPQENLRDILRQQLSSLRNMKKTNNYFTDINKKTEIASQTLKKKRKSIDLNSLSRLSATDDDEIPINEPNKQSNPLISHTDETQFVIMNVSGGIDLVSDNKSESERNFASVNDNKKIEKPPLVAIRKDLCSTSFNSDPGVSHWPKKSEKSPFVSDSLDNFLNDSSELKVSYDLPKLGAEEGLSESSKTDQYENLYNNQTPIPVNPREKREKVIKAKTLAEMRRQVEKLNSKPKKTRLEFAKKEKIKSEPDDGLLKVTKIDTIKETKPFLRKIPKTKTVEEVMQSMRQHRNAYIIYNKKKLTVSSVNRDECVAVINTMKKHPKKRYRGFFKKFRNIPPKKPSLLATLTQNKTDIVKYRPGPLSRKAQLQDTASQDHWTSYIKKLPSIHLEVTPEIGKPLDPLALHRLPVFDNVVISAERAKFAVSVVQTKNCTQISPKSFTFPVPYKNNQVNMLVRQRHQKPQIPIVEECNLTPKQQIESVINDLISYVEIKDLEPGLIQNEDISNEIKEPINEDGTNPTTKKQKKKINRLRLEMNRLSCKVIDVATNSDDNFCKKPYCRLGCICKSLKCEKIYHDHCQQPQCMFECSCPPIVAEQILGSGNSSLSSTSVNHLDDKVKRNLAKVERDFTQTLIQTDDDVILVGSAGRNKMRRATKTPKKYYDFVDINDENKPEPIPIVEQSVELKQCTIDVENLVLDNLIPYCLCHKMYNCHCKNQSVEFIAETPKIQKVPKIVIVKKAKEEEKYVPEWTPGSDAECARIRIVYDHYKIRNKHQQYREKLEKKLQRKYPYITTKFEKIIPEETPPETTKKPTNKRKQSFEIREDIIPNLGRKREFALQRRKKLKKGDFISMPTIQPYHQVFEGELRLSLRENQDLLKIVGEENAGLEYIRLLPWNSLIRGFNTSKILIWAKNRKYSQVLCNVSNHQPPNNFLDIRLVVEKPQIVKWILSGKPPNDKPVKFLHLVLLPKKDNFIIAGYCLKNVQAVPDISINNEVEIEEMNTLNNALTTYKNLLDNTNFQGSIVQMRSVKCSHKDISNEQQILILTNRIFKPRRLFNVCDEKNTSKISDAVILVQLPPVTKTFRWRMIYLNSDFSFLRFTASQYSIKYTDLLDVVKMAQKINVTTTLHNRLFCQHYHSPIFGIYCVPKFPDRLFIGPYKPDEEDGIETLRYLQGTLVNTSIFNKMRGLKKSKANWVYEMSKPEPILPQDLIIDITGDDDEMKLNDLDITIIKSDQTENEENFIDSVKDNFLCEPFVEILTGEELEAKKVNRYFITNIPHFGYMEAYQRDNKAIDVYWPTGDIGYRFPNVTFAKNSLIQLLSQILFPVPIGFKIDVVILTNLDLFVNKPVDAKYFTNHSTQIYICGEFGVFGEDNIPPTILTQFNVKTIYSFLETELRIEHNVEKLIRLFAMFLMSNEELRKNSNLDQILKWAVSEIYVLRKLDQNFEAEKRDLKMLLSSKKKKIEEVSTVTKKEFHVLMKNIEQLKRKSPIKKTNNNSNSKLQVTETIEIIDSDEEEEKEEKIHSEAVHKVTTVVYSNGNQTNRSLLRKKIGMNQLSLLKDKNLPVLISRNNSVIIEAKPNSS